MPEALPPETPPDITEVSEAQPDLPDLPVSHVAIGALSERYVGDPQKCPYLRSLGGAGLTLDQVIGDTAKSPPRGPTMAELLALRSQPKTVAAPTAAKPEPVKLAAVAKPAEIVASATTDPTTIITSLNGPVLPAAAERLRIDEPAHVQQSVKRPSTGNQPAQLPTPETIGIPSKIPRMKIPAAVQVEREIAQSTTPTQPIRRLVAAELNRQELIHDSVAIPRVLLPFKYERALPVETVTANRETLLPARVMSDNKLAMSEIVVDQAPSDILPEGIQLPPVEPMIIEDITDAAIVLTAAYSENQQLAEQSVAVEDASFEPRFVTFSSSTLETNLPIISPLLSMAGQPLADTHEESSMVLTAETDHVILEPIMEAAVAGPFIADIPAEAAQPQAATINTALPSELAEAESDEPETLELTAYAYSTSTAEKSLLTRPDGAERYTADRLNRLGTNEYKPATKRLRLSSLLRTMRDTFSGHSRLGRYALATADCRLAAMLV